MTKARVKPEDYREITPYWLNRFARRKCEMLYDDVLEEIEMLGKGYGLSECFEFNVFDLNIMTLGYPSKTDTSRILKLEHKGIESAMRRISGLTILFMPELL